MRGFPKKLPPDSPALHIGCDVEKRDFPCRPQSVPIPGPGGRRSAGRRRFRRQARLDPAEDVGEHGLLADVVEQVVEMPVVELQRLVRGAGLLEEILAPLADRRLVGGAVQDALR